MKKDYASSLFLISSAAIPDARRKIWQNAVITKQPGLPSGTSARLYPCFPMTVATEAWYTGFHPYTLEPVFSAKTQREKLAQRQFFFWYKPEERRNIINELRRIGRTDLIDKLYGKR